MDVAGAVLPRIPTGIPGLDHLSGGGLPKGEVTLLAGPTGSGKTLMATQFLAEGISRLGERGVFVTFGEQTGKIRRFARTLGWDVDTWEARGDWGFVDASPGGDQEVAIGQDFDFTPLVARIAAAVGAISAKRVVMDSISEVLARLGGAPQVRDQLLRLVAGVEKLGVTTIITAERAGEDAGDARMAVEEFVADNIILLRNRLTLEKRRRTVEVLKLRGGRHRGGEFPFVILPDGGASVVALSELKLGYPSGGARISLGNPDLDEMCGGGPFQDSIILVTGPTGTGKTLLALEYLDAPAEEGRGLLVAFEESAAQLTRNARGWGHDLDAMQASGRMQLLCQYPESAPHEAHLLRIQQVIEEFKPTRVAVDSLSGIARGANPRDFHEFMLGLTWFLKARQINGLFTTTTPSLPGDPTASGLEASTLLDMIILLRYVEAYGELHRGVSILKMRGSNHAKTINEYVIGPDGMRVGDPFRTTTGILSGESLQLLGEERRRVSAEFRDADPAG